MAATVMEYWRVLCDVEDCPAYINVAAVPNGLVDVLAANKWTARMAISAAHLNHFCPAHGRAFQ